jgi:multidrug efflux pump subunit AcrA (membrane-fusion protein)
VANGGAADVDAATQNRVDAENALKQAQQQLSDTVQPSKDALNASVSELETARQDAQKGIVRAPITGTIVGLEAKPGLSAKSKQPLAEIINFNLVRVQGTVPPELKDQVKRLSHVIVALNGQSSAPLDGRVTEVKVVPPVAGQSGSSYLAVIEFVNPGSSVTQSTSVKRIGVKTGEVKGALVVPASAVTQRDGKSYVSVQKGNDWVQVPVETGLSDGALVEIKSGVSESDIVKLGSQ